MAALGLRCCVGFSLAVAGGCSLIAVHGSLPWLLLLWSSGSVAAAPGLWSMGSTLQCVGLVLHSMGDLPGPGMEPTSPALAGGFFTTEPPGEPCCFLEIFKIFVYAFIFGCAVSLLQCTGF